MNSSNLSGMKNEEAGQPLEKSTAFCLKALIELGFALILIQVILIVL